MLSVSRRVLVSARYLIRHDLRTAAKYDKNTFSRRFWWRTTGEGAGQANDQSIKEKITLGEEERTIQIDMTSQSGVTSHIDMTSQSGVTSHTDMTSQSGVTSHTSQSVVTSHIDKTSHGLESAEFKEKDDVFQATSFAHSDHSQVPDNADFLESKIFTDVTSQDDVTSRTGVTSPTDDVTLPTDDVTSQTSVTSQVDVTSPTDDVTSQPEMTLHDTHVDEVEHTPVIDNETDLETVNITDKTLEMKLRDVGQGHDQGQNESDDIEEISHADGSDSAVLLPRKSDNKKKTYPTTSKYKPKSKKFAKSDDLLKELAEFGENVPQDEAIFQALAYSEYQSILNKYLESRAVEGRYKGEIQKRLKERERKIARLYTGKFTSFAPFVNESVLLQKLLALGVDLSRLETKKGIPHRILKMDFEQDVMPYVRFLNKHGVDKVGRFLSINPWILTEDIDDLEVRINYFLSKRFTVENVTALVNHDPRLLCRTVQDIDSRLGKLQKKFNLSGVEVRKVVMKYPKIVSYPWEVIEMNHMHMCQLLNFKQHEVEKMVIQQPAILTLEPQNLVNRFEYIHNTMRLPHEMIVKFPVILTTRMFRLRERHEYLVHVGRAQYDPKKENYVSLDAITLSNDDYFITEIAKTTVEEFHAYLKTI